MAAAPSFHRLARHGDGHAATAPRGRAPLAPLPRHADAAADQRHRRMAVILGAYAAAAVVAAGGAAVLGRDPLACEAWLGIGGAAAALVSAGAGVMLAAVVVAGTRRVVRRAAWARALHAGLRPAVHGTGDAWLIAVALASAVGEELLFRGLLVPLLGVVASSLLFGALHQMRGRARWGWVAWATLMGLALGALFAATGSLVGPIVAHAIVNGANLRFLRDHDPAPRRRKLGGLLQRDAV